MTSKNCNKQLQRLDERLRSGTADKLTDAQHAQIEAAVLNRLRRTDAAANRPIATRRHWRPLAIGIAAAAMVLLAVSVFIRPEQKSEPQVLDLAALVQVWEGSETLTRQIPQWTRWPEQTMQTEMNRLTDDTQRAVAFLLNCTPGNPLLEMNSINPD